MVYTEFQGLRLSQLGFGAMRLPLTGKELSMIDKEQTAKMIEYAIEHGVNYFDTAYAYHGGKSELVLGEILSRYPRDSYHIATKFPGYDLKYMNRVEEIFEEQLKKCRVDYFDFYLFHNVCEMNINGYFNPDYGIYDYLIEQKKNGRIRHLGFSCHGEIDILNRFLESYGDDMEFCQLQLNYLDWEFQHGREKYEIIRKAGIPVWVMEPLRGGNLTRLSPENAERLRKLRPDESAVQWAFRFIQSLPDVKVVLSGMSSFAQIADNIQTFEEDKPLNGDEMKQILTIGGQIAAAGTIPCTACRYCTSHCPQKLDIPRLIALYNEHSLPSDGFLAPMALKAMPAGKRPDACIACRSCEQVCPQKLKISEILADFVKKLGMAHRP